jgi:hypothetical protein
VLNPLSAVELMSGSHQEDPLVIILSLEKTKLNLEMDYLRGSIKYKTCSLEVMQTIREARIEIIHAETVSSATE